MESSVCVSIGRKFTSLIIHLSGISKIRFQTLTEIIRVNEVVAGIVWWVIRAEIARMEAEDAKSCEKQIKKIDEQLEPLQSKLSRLTHSYLDEIIEEDDYKSAKEELILQKTALKREKERLRKTRSSAWIEPALEVVSRLETMGNETFPNSYSAIAEQVRKIGTNPVISGKTVTFSLSEPYASIPSLLASTPIATLAPRASRCEEERAFTKWCAIQGSNL